MAVNKNIGFFRGIVERVNVLSHKNNISIQPVSPIADQKIDFNTFKTLSSIKDSYGANGVFHWNFHNWGDTSNVVGK